MTKILYPKGQGSSSLWHHNGLQKHFSWPLFSAITEGAEGEPVTSFHICSDAELVTLILGAHLATVVTAKIFCAARLKTYFKEEFEALATTIFEVL